VRGAAAEPLQERAQRREEHGEQPQQRGDQRSDGQPDGAERAEQVSDGAEDEMGEPVTEIAHTDIVGVALRVGRAGVTWSETG
jgi:hypothetical protein